jgi:hypothetical protein
MKRHLLSLVALSTLGGCGIYDSHLAHQAQVAMIGMTADDLQACAGVPDKTTKINDRTSIYDYKLAPGPTGSITATLPVVGGMTLGGSGPFCTASFRVIDGKVTDVHYSGDSDKTFGEDAVCVPIIRGCMRQPEASMRADAKETWHETTLWHEPAPPAQPPHDAPLTAPAAASSTTAKMP